MRSQKPVAEFRARSLTKVYGAGAAEVQAHIVIWSGNALRIPMTALFRSGDAWSVFAIRNGRAQQQRVEIGHRGGSDVIVHPSDQIRAGVRVKSEASS